MTLRLEDALLETAERIVIRGGATTHAGSMCAEGIAWLGGTERASVLFGGLLEAARAAQPDDRAQRLSSLVAAQARARWLTEARRTTDDLAAVPVTWDSRLSHPLQVAEARLECRQPDLVREALVAAREALRIAARPQYLVQKLALLQIDAGDPTVEETWPLLRDGEADAFSRSGVVRVAVRLGKREEAWDLLLTLLDEPTNFAVAIADVIQAAPGRADEVRELVERERDPHTRATLLVSIARGLAFHPDYFDAAMEMLDEALLRLAGAPAQHRWDALVRSAEVASAAGRGALTARYARQAEECLGAHPDPHRLGGTGRALARSGEREAAHRLLLDWLARTPDPASIDWEMPVLWRDIAITFPAPADR